MAGAVARGLLAACLLAALAAGPAAAQVVSLKQPAPIARGVAALPRIATPATPATTKINAALARLDKSWLAFRKQCGADTGRSVNVTMRGPGYLSLVVNMDYYCGGAHPDNSSIALVYDLASWTG